MDIKRENPSKVIFIDELHYQNTWGQQKGERIIHIYAYMHMHTYIYVCVCVCIYTCIYRYNVNVIFIVLICVVHCTVWFTTLLLVSPIE